MIEKNYKRLFSDNYKLKSEILGEDYTMSENDKMKCFEFFKEAYTHYKSYRRFGYISIRSLVRTFDYYIASSNSGGNWQQRSVSSA